MDLLGKNPSDTVALQCFAKLDKIISLKASAALIVLAYECGLDSVAALGSAMYAYFANPTEARSAKIDAALQKVLDEANDLSDAAVATARAKQKTAERDTHGWGWKLIHCW